MQDLLLLLVCLMFVTVGFMSPFVLTLGYVWVDVFAPHYLSYGMLSSTPIAFIMGASAVASYLLMDRKSPPRFTAITALQVALGIWITCTTQWALVPAVAYVRWDFAIKVAVFATFVPYAIRSRVQIEALLLVYVFSMAGHILPWGLKTSVSGGGYELALGLLPVNASLLSESSTVAGIGVMMAALLMWISGHSIILPRLRIVKLGLYAMMAFGLIATIGTFARTGLVAIAVGAGSLFWRSKHKFRFLVGAAVMGGIMAYFASDKWAARISTVNTYQADASAMIRVRVWEWTWDFAQTHPFGGGFWVFQTNKVTVPAVDGGSVTIYGRAFHNVFFALLGEHGYPGLVLYVALIVACFLALRRTVLLTRGHEEHRWAADLARALQTCILVMFAVGNFVEIGWSPIIWYLFSLSVCLREYARRVLQPVTAKALQPWERPQRARGLGPALGAPPLGGPPLGGSIGDGVAGRPGLGATAMRRTTGA